MNNKCLLGSCTQPWRLEIAATQTKPACAGFKPLVFHKSAQADFACIAATSSRLILTIATLVLSLAIPISAYAVEVAQVPTQPNLPQNLPPPRDVVPPPSAPPQPQPLPSPPPSGEDLLPTQPTQEPQEQFPAVIPDKFFVTKFEFIGGTKGKGSTVFKNEELLRAIEVFLDSSDSSEKLSDEKSKCEKFLGKLDKQSVPRTLPRTENHSRRVELTFTQLLQARSAITQLYICKGYITSGAIIPEQTLSSGVVKIQIIEGSLEDIKITGTRRLNQGYIRSRLAAARKKPLNRDRLLEELQLLQLNPRINSLSAELAAGKRFGTNLLEVKVKEANTFHSRIALDNSRSPSVGSFQRSVQLWEDNLLGIGDTISLFYANTDGSNEVDVSYTLPLTPQNTTLSFNYGHTSNNIIEKPFNELDIVSDSDKYQLTLRHPLIQTPTKEFAIGVETSHQETQTFLGYQNIGAYPISPGADNEGRTRITAVRFFQEWTQRGDVSVLALRSKFSFGIDALGSTINDIAPDSEFFAWRGQAQWLRRFGSDMFLVLRGDVQLADRRLVTLEQFGIGGIASVRGYRQDQVLTDNGAFGSIELRLPILRIREAQSVLQFIPFVDAGTGWNNFDGADPNPSWLVSAGFGLRFQMSDRLDARFDWGIPLISADSNERTLQEKGLYFSVIWNPF